jgi:hypothetical protein
MGDPMKFKIFLTVISLITLTFIPLIKSNFGAPVTIKRWDILTWEDFQGIAKPFTGFAAGINSYIYLEFDSLKSTYYAFAGQNNQRSWRKRNIVGEDYVLNHEQYHFNISEVHARRLNTKLVSENADKVQDLLFSHRVDLLAMQDLYDNETGHGKFADRQRRWEYKIDSLMQHYEKDSVFVTEYYSGARAYFPSKPGYDEGIANNSVYKGYFIDNYDMNISMISILLENINNMEYVNISQDNYPQDSAVFLSFEERPTPYDRRIVFSGYDTMNQTKQIHHWIINKPYLYRLYIQYPRNTQDSTGYEQIAESFFNSFSIINTDDYFFSKVKDNYQLGTNTIGDEVDKSELKGQECMTHMAALPNGFYRGPMYNEIGEMLFAHDVLKHPDSLLLSNIMVIGNYMFDSGVALGDQIILIPKQHIPTKNEWVSLGYFLKEDTVDVCYKYYNQMIYIDSESDQLNNILQTF